MAEDAKIAPAGDGSSALQTALTDAKTTEVSRDPTVVVPVVDEAAKVSLDAAKAAVAANTATDEQKAAVDADKVATDKKAEDAKSDKAKAGAPEKYEDFKLPEGVVLDKAAVEGFLPVAKELNLTQEQAQKLVDYQTSIVTKAAADNAKAFTDMSEGWLNSAKADPEFGQGKWDESMVKAKAFVTKFGGPKVFEAMDASQLGNHPEVLRMFVKAGEALVSDNKVLTGSVTSRPQTQADIAAEMYPSMAKK